MAKNKKIATDGQHRAVASNPFAALSKEGLPSAKEPTTAANSEPAKAVRKHRGRVDVQREKSGRGGKWVTVAKGEGFLHTAPSELEKILKQWKNQLGCGGTLKGKILEIQGDQRAFVTRELTKMGYRVVLTGG